MFRNAKILLIALICSIFTTVAFVANAGIPLDGAYKGIAFSVEKNGQTLFDDSKVYSFNSEMVIETVSSDVIKATINVTIKPTAQAQEITKNRIDRFKVNWTSSTSGKLKNLNPNLKNDRSEFKFLDGKLTFRSWIARHQTWEVQSYKRR